MKICAECKYYIIPTPQRGPLCGHNKAKDIVTGGQKSCLYMRKGILRCGVWGCNWESKKEIEMPNE